MKVYLVLFFSHIIGDILLQRNGILRKFLKGRELWQLKRQNKMYILLHVMLYILPIAGVFIYLQLFTWYRIIIIFVSHFVIDYVKCYMVNYEFMSKKFFAINIIDQFLHVSILLAIVNI